MDQARFTDLTILLVKQRRDELEAGGLTPLGVFDVTPPGWVPFGQAVVDGRGLFDGRGRGRARHWQTEIHVARLHFFASWSINPQDRGGRGPSSKEVQADLGHSSVVMTLDTYGHLFPRGHDHGALAASSALLG
jgi:integrase